MLDLLVLHVKIKIKKIHMLYKQQLPGVQKC